MAGLHRWHALTCVRVRSVQRVEQVRERRASVFKAGVLTVVKARQEETARREAKAQLRTLKQAQQTLREIQDHVMMRKHLP